MATWDILIDETPREYSLFRKFLFMGENRSFEMVATEVGLSGARVSQIARKNSWDLRSVDYERFLMALQLDAEKDKFKQVDGNSVVNDSLRDYHKLLNLWEIKYQDVINNINDLDAEVISKLVIARSRIDAMGRLASGLNKNTMPEAPPNTGNDAKEINWGATVVDDEPEL